MSKACAAPAPQGSACASSFDCAYPLLCVAGTCATSGAAGAACASDDDCVNGFGCDATAHTCAPIVWAGAEEPCGNLRRCLVGDCSEPPTGSGADGGTGGATCSAIIPDGQPCDAGDLSAVCDVLAWCGDEGVCTLVPSDACQRAPLPLP